MDAWNYMQENIKYLNCFAVKSQFSVTSNICWNKLESLKKNYVQNQTMCKHVLIDSNKNAHR